MIRKKKVINKRKRKTVCSSWFKKIIYINIYVFVKKKKWIQKKKKNQRKTKNKKIYFLFLFSTWTFENVQGGLHT